MKIEYIKSPDLSNKILREVKWDKKIGDFISENSQICVLHIDQQENSLLTQILNEKIYKKTSAKITSKTSGTLHKTYSVEEIAHSGIICEISLITQELSLCSHEIEFGGICAKCGEVIDK